jgi:23S rRNA (cytidine2498-2'-O)-methyltransferase
VFDADRLLALCRPGFEGDTAAELTERVAAAGAWGHARTRDEGGLVEFFPGDADPLALLLDDVFADRVFARQICASGPLIERLPPEDRLTPLLEGLDRSVADALVEFPEDQAHLALSKLAGRLNGPLKGILQRRGLWKPEGVDALRVHVIMDGGDRAWLGLSPMDRSSPHPGGIQRQRSHRDAPSRSALKLEEGLLTLLSPVDQHLAFNGRVTAVDLGAAPGGWTWVLRRRGVHVIAVDNGPLAPDLVDDPEVEHVRADGFTFQPAEPVHWLVCDMVDKPARVVETMARWLRRGWARRALFNLKLPMRRRWHAVADAHDRFHRVLGDRSGDFDLRVRHLYHDREEVTCLAEPRRGS